MRSVFLLLFCLLLSHALLYAQRDSTATLQAYTKAVASKAGALSSQLDRKTEKLLTSFQRREAKLLRKLSRRDSTKAMALKQAGEARYQTLQQTLSGNGLPTSYNASLDTLKTSLRFLQEGKWLLPKESLATLEKAQGSLKDLDKSLASTEAVKTYLRERRQQLKESIGKLFPKDLKKLNKQAYYYARQVAQYKETLKDKKKVEKKALELLTQSKAYKDFFRRNSELARLFRLPGGEGSGGSPATAVSLQGLQTRASVNQALVDRFGSGPQVTAQLRENLQAAQGQLAALKDKAQRLGQGSFGSGGDIELPEGFKPNTQKTKTFLQRLEYGANLQNTKGSSFLPVTSDLGLSIGYKLNDKGSLGIGTSYKLGWGQGFKNLKLSGEGVGLRSYGEYKLKGSLFVSGGYELNYRSSLGGVLIPSPFGGGREGVNQWQKSGLVGVSKKYKAGKKLKGDLKLLWDFLSYQQVPRTQAVVFRVGYNIK